MRVHYGSVVRARLVDRRKFASRYARKSDGRYRTSFGPTATQGGPMPLPRQLRIVFTATPITRAASSSFNEGSRWARGELVQDALADQGLADGELCGGSSCEAAKACNSPLSPRARTRARHGDDRSSLAILSGFERRSQNDPGQSISTTGAGDWQPSSLQRIGVPVV